MEDDSWAQGEDLSLDVARVDVFDKYEYSWKFVEDDVFADLARLLGLRRLGAVGGINKATFRFWRKEQMDGEYGSNQVMATTSLKEAISREPNLRERIDQSVVRAQKRLDDAKRAAEILEKNPDLEELLNIIQRQGNF